MALASSCREEFFKGCHGHYFKPLVSYSTVLRTNWWREYKKGSWINFKSGSKNTTHQLADENPECHVLVSSQTTWEYRDTGEEKSAQAESDGSGPKKSRCKLLSEQLWASELFTCVLEPKLIPKYVFLPIHLQIENTQTTTTNLVLQTSPFLSAFLMVYRESNRDSRCCSLNRRHFSVNTSASLISMDGSFPQQK